MNHRWFVALTFPNFSQKRGARRRARYGSAHAKNYQVQAQQCYRKATRNGFSGSHDRCVTGGVYRSTQQDIGRTKDNCLKMDDLAQAILAQAISCSKSSLLEREVNSNFGVFCVSGPPRCYASQAMAHCRSARWVVPDATGAQTAVSPLAEGAAQGRTKPVCTASAGCPTRSQGKMACPEPETR